MNSTERNIFIALLRAALWEREADLSIYKKGVWNWSVLIDALMKHDLLGVVANTIILLPDDVKPSPKEMVVVYSYLACLMQSHRKLNMRLADIMPRLEAVGCHPILLKGQGLSVLFPKDCVRSCGDLDIYVGEDMMDKAVSVVNALATQDELDNVDETASHHYHICLDGIEYELHRAPGDSVDKRYREAYLSEASRFLQPEQCEKVALPVSNAETVQISVPSVDFNIWYIFNHLMVHFIHDGVGYRQFCDWMMAIKEYNRRGTMAHDQLEDILQRIGLLRAWKILGGILVYQLGLPAVEFPLYDARLAKKSQGYIINQIMGGERFFFAYHDDIGERGRGLRHFFYNLHLYYYKARPLSVLSPWAPYINYCKRIRIASCVLLGIRPSFDL